MNETCPTGSGIAYRGIAGGLLFALPACLVLAFTLSTAHGEEKKPVTVEDYLRHRGLAETESFRKWMRQAVLELKSQNYFRAAEMLVKVVDGFPEHPVPCMLLGLTFAATGYLEQASLYFRKGVSLFPGIRDADFSFNTYQPDEEELVSLVDGLRKKMETRPPESKARSQGAFVAATVLFFSGHRKDSRALFAGVPAKAVERPASVWFLRAFETGEKKKEAKPGKDFFALGNRYFLKGRYRDSAFAYGWAYMDDPKNVVACFEFAHALFACGEFSKAARMIVHGIGRYPEWSGVSMDRREYYAKDRRDDFFRQLERLRDECLKAPDDPSLAYLLGYCLYFTARRAEAEKAFRKAKVSGWIGEADYFLATLRGRGGTVPEAGKPTPPKPKNSIDTWLTNLGRGKKAFDAREYDASAREYAQALKVRPEAHMVRFELARSLFAAARYADAEKEVRAGLSSLPQSQRDQIPWMNAYADKALFQEHLTALEARCRKGGGSIFLLAFSLFYSGNFQRAAEEFEKVFILNSSDRQAIYYFKLIDKLGKKK